MLHCYPMNTSRHIVPYYVIHYDSTSHIVILPYQFTRYYYYYLILYHSIELSITYFYNTASYHHTIASYRFCVISFNHVKSNPVTI